MECHGYVFGGLCSDYSERIILVIHTIPIIKSINIEIFSTYSVLNCNKFILGASCQLGSTCNWINDAIGASENHYVNGAGAVAARGMFAVFASELTCRVLEGQQHYIATEGTRY